jgi:hypothetical protein
MRASLCGDRAVLRELGFAPERMTWLRVRLEPLRPERWARATPVRAGLPVTLARLLPKAA